MRVPVTCLLLRVGVKRREKMMSAVSLCVCVKTHHRCSRRCRLSSPRLNHTYTQRGCSGHSHTGTARARTVSASLRDGEEGGAHSDSTPLPTTSSFPVITQSYPSTQGHSCTMNNEWR